MKKWPLLFLLWTLPLSASENVAWKDFKESFADIFRAFPSQFKARSNAYATAIATPMLAYSFDQDDRLSALFRSKKENWAINLVGDMAIAANFPIIPFGFYAWGRSHHDERLIRFSKEVFIATYLAGWQIIAISLLPINERPNDDVSFWEKSFRGGSSFPSGHVMPFAVLTMKTLQYYGPLRAMIPAALTLATGYQRVQEGKHYLSDVIGGLLLSVIASEGTRVYTNYQGNHPFYKAIFEHEVSVSFMRKEESPGLLVSWTY